MKPHISYKAAIEWIAANDDNEWLESVPYFPPIAPSMIADLFELPMTKIVADLIRAAAPFHIKTNVDYHWVRFDGGQALLPIGEKNPHSLKRIAIIAYDGNIHHVSYFYPGGAGNRSYRTARLKTVHGAERWVARELGRFERPPLIF